MELQARLAQIFSAGGPIAALLKDFEERKEQRTMSEQILSAYEQDLIALIEAGTGTGKSLAYLVPAFLWALATKEKSVISTNTISLQEQLIKKDIPFLLKALDVDLKVSLVKGMSNYLCLRKLDELKEWEFGEKKSQLEVVENWAETTREGSRSDLSFPMTATAWEEVAADSDSCTGVQCPHFDRCFFFRARRQSSDAQILIVNHHLLIADLSSKKESGILPDYSRLVIDEAHHFEQIALEALSVRIEPRSVIRLLEKLIPTLSLRPGRLAALEQTLVKLTPAEPSGAFSSLMQRIRIDLPAEKRLIVLQIEKAFKEMEAFCHQLFQTAEQKRRLRTFFFEHPELQSHIRPLFDELMVMLKRMAASLLALEADCEQSKEFEPSEKLRGQLIELHATAGHLEEIAAEITAFFSIEELPQRVRYLEESPFALSDVNLDVSSYLNEHLFKKLSTVTLCSATLAPSRDFTFLHQQLGLGERKTCEGIYDSPFDYLYRTLLLVPTDLPLPTDKAFIPAASEAIFEALLASSGSAFVLFTSYDMLQSCYEAVVKRAEGRFKKEFLLRQGDAPRQVLIEKFKKSEGSVLFGTDSFWEGVDVAGEALRNVIIVKLPFKVPSDPIAQAYGELLVQKGKDAFLDYSLPHAVVKFKQGFGRLMRKKNDRGCILCLDKRLVTKGYGNLFLKSLPPCQTLFDQSARIFSEMKEFYRKVK